MRHKAISLLILGFLGLLAPTVLAQNAGDSPDRFLTAYTLYQKGEQKEQNKDFNGAQAAYQEAAGILDDIKSKDPTWNPTILEYRRKRVTEGLTRVGPKATTPATLPTPSGGPLTPGTNGGIIPNGPDESETNLGAIPGMDKPSTGSPKRAESRTTRPASTGSEKDPLSQITDQLEKLRADAKAAQAEAAEARRGRDELKEKLAETAKNKAKIEDEVSLARLRAENAEKALRDERQKTSGNAEQVQVLQAQALKYRKQLRDLEIENSAAQEYNTQLKDRSAKSSTTVKTMQADLEKANAAQIDAQKKIEAAEKRADALVAEVQKKLDAALKERDTLLAKLTTVSEERDAARKEVTQLKEAQKNLDKLVADNAQLMTKLSDAEKQITQFKADNAQKDVLIADLKKEVNSVKLQLDDAKKESASYQSKMADLQKRLDTTAEQLAMAKTSATTTAAEQKRLAEENSLLRGIVNRQMKAQAARDQTRKLVLAEMAKLKIKSDDLLQRINFLGEPVVKLTEKERLLFKKPQVEVGDNEIALVAPKQGESESPLSLPSADSANEPTLASLTPSSLTPPAPAQATPTPKPAENTVAKASPAASKPVPIATPIPISKPAASTPTVSKPAIAATTPAPATPPILPIKEPVQEVASLGNTKLTDPTRGPFSLERATPAPARESKEPRTEPATGGNVTETGAGASSVPTELQPVAQEAKDQFDRGNYRSAEQLYERILAKAPTNLYALSNLGVVRFREGKLKLAEEAFKKAIAIAPEDAFSRCTLGIIYYSQSRYDEAVNELTKSLAINPKYAAAHNFLGITASQKGWQEAAQKELETATALDPNYADAHFNLAVVYATQQPPNKENARQFYKKATELGAEADPSLEALLK